MCASYAAIEPTVDSRNQVKSAAQVWLVAALAGLSVSWPLLFAALLHGPAILIRLLTGDAYHYLAIARKAILYHIYTYDGVHVTNGFHPLWEYTIRGMFYVLGLQTHESEAVAVMILASVATTLGVVLASAAVVRMTNQSFLGLMLVPGLFYMAIGVHVRTLWIWSSMDGMESAFSLLFGGVFFLVLSYYMGLAAQGTFDLVAVYRALGIVSPFLIMTRLDDALLVPALLAALYIFEPSAKRRLAAGLWIALPTFAVISCYLIYNRLTAGAAMPLSGSTKSGFAGFVFDYLLAAVHFPPVLDLKYLLSKKAANGEVIFSNSFRVVEVAYPLLLAAFGVVGIWRHRKRDTALSIWFGICLYIVFKEGYNLLFVHAWHQSSWYFILISLCLTVMGTVWLRDAWSRTSQMPVTRVGVMALYLALMMLSASQFYATIVYPTPAPLADLFWQRRSEISSQLAGHGVRGVINVDDGITAFLIDLPMMHGFAFATDVEAQKAHKEGRMLTVAYSRGINTIAGFDYLSATEPPKSQAEIVQYLQDSLAAGPISLDINDFDFTLAYYDPVIKMPFISFKPKLR